MKSNQLKIKNMMCPSCIIVLMNELKDMGMEVLDIKIGEVTIKPQNGFKICELEKRIKKVGFEILHNPEELIVEELKMAIRNYLIKMEEATPIENLSNYLSKSIGRNYSNLSRIFSKSELITIENYFITQRIKRVKSLLVQGNMSLSEIAVSLRYSSVHYLSQQFKKIMGITVTEYKAKLNGEKNAKSRKFLPVTKSSLGCNFMMDSASRINWFEMHLN